MEDDESLDICAIKNMANASLNPLVDAGIATTIELQKSESESVISLRVEYKPVVGLSVQQRIIILKQMEENVRQFYELEWGWNENDRKKELFSADAKFILLQDEATSDIVGWTMFKFDWDDLDEPEHCVLFCYELHVAHTLRGHSCGAKVSESTLCLNGSNLRLCNT
jgi:hypothetical protein